MINMFQKNKKPKEIAEAIEIRLKTFPQKIPLKPGKIVVNHYLRGRNECLTDNQLNIW